MQYSSPVFSHILSPILENPSHQHTSPPDFLYFVPADLRHFIPQLIYSILLSLNVDFFTHIKALFPLVIEENLSPLAVFSNPASFRLTHQILYSPSRTIIILPGFHLWTFHSAKILLFPPPHFWGFQVATYWELFYSRLLQNKSSPGILEGMMSF